MEKLFDKKFIDQFFAEAAESPRLRQNHDLRNSADDTSQRMLNALMPDTIVPIHQHTDTAETVICLCGKLEEILYEREEVANENGATDVLSHNLDNSNIEARKMVYLQKVIDDCKVNNIQLVMCYSPYYGQGIPKSIRMVEKLAAKNHVPFLNYGDDARFQKPKYFQDASHLNDTGAKEYSMEVCRAIKGLN